MDPNETLRKLRAMVTAINNDRGASGREDHTAQLFIDLDEWLTKGGFVPNDWYHPTNYSANG